MTHSPCCQESPAPADYERLLGADVVQFIALMRGQERSESQLISVLHRVQQAFGYLSPQQMDAVAQLLQVPAAMVSGVATFYHFFRFQAPGRHKISVCLGTACYVKGASTLAARLKDELGVEWGETSKDGMFTLEAARCLGTCGLAPVVMIDDNVHGQVTPEQIPSLLDAYRRKTAAPPPAAPPAGKQG
jgi:NADH:ubiquinone oxidoreductase subunit E